MPSYFACSFDFKNDCFLCKGDKVPQIHLKTMGKESDEEQSESAQPSVDPILLEIERAIKEKIELEASKELSQMRYYMSVCKGFPQHGVRGGKTFWSKACFQDAKYTQKLRQHGAQATR